MARPPKLKRAGARASPHRPLSVACSHPSKSHHQCLSLLHGPTLADIIRCITHSGAWSVVVPSSGSCGSSGVLLSAAAASAWRERSFSPSLASLRCRGKPPPSLRPFSVLLALWLASSGRARGTPAARRAGPALPALPTSIQAETASVRDSMGRQRVGRGLLPSRSSSATGTDANNAKWLRSLALRTRPSSQQPKTPRGDSQLSPFARLKRCG